MQIYLSPRSRPIYYYRIGTDFGINPESKSEVKKKLTEKLGTAKRLLQENIPALTKVFSGLKSQGNAYTLPGVQSVAWGYAREVTEEYGLQAYMMLPWYTKAITVTVRGKFYLGAFNTLTSAASALLSPSPKSGDKVNPGSPLLPPPDFFREEMKTLDDMLSGVNLASRNSKDYTQTSALVSMVQVGQPGDMGGLQLMGFIKGFDVDETIAAPYVQNYTLTYLGVDYQWYLDAQARMMKIYDNEKQRSNTANVGATTQ